MNRVSTDVGRRRLTEWLPWTLAVIAAMGLGHVTTVAHEVARNESPDVVRGPREKRRSAIGGDGRTNARSAIFPPMRFCSISAANACASTPTCYRAEVVIINSFFGTCRESCLPAESES